MVKWLKIQSSWSNGRQKKNNNNKNVHAKVSVLVQKTGSFKPQNLIHNTQLNTEMFSITAEEVDVL